MRRSDLKHLIKEIVRTCLESPDNVTFKDPNDPTKKVRANYSDKEHVVSVILIWDVNGKPTYFAYLPRQKTVKSSNKEYETRWQEWLRKNPNNNLAQGRTATHHHVITSVVMAMPEFNVKKQDAHGNDVRPIKRITNARLYEHDKTYIIAFWETLRIIRPVAHIVQDLFHDIGVDFQTTLFEPSGYEGNYISADEFLGTAVAKPEFTTNAMKDKELAHLMAPDDPRKKKAMAKNIYKRKDQIDADKAKMSVSQLRQMYPGMAAAE